MLYVLIIDDAAQENYTASRMVLAASGVDHDKLLEYAEPLLSDLPNVSRCHLPKPIYTGGDFRRQGDSGVCIRKALIRWMPCAHSLHVGLEALTILFFYLC